MRRYAFEAIIAHLLWFAFFFALNGGFHTPITLWLESFFQWDARWYATIAQDGHGFLPQTYVFPPLHGWILGRLTDVAFFLQSLVSSSPSWVNLFYPVTAVAGFASFLVANTMFVVLSERRWNIDRPRLWLIAVSNPMAYFVFTAYSDNLFYALMMATMILILVTSPRSALWRLPVLSATHQRLAKLALMIQIAILPWVRLTGFATAAWLVIRRKEAIATFASLVAFLLYYWIRTDDPVFFLFVQRVFQMPEGNGIKGFATSLEIFSQLFTGLLFRGSDFFIYGLNFGILPIVTLALSILSIVWLWRRREFEWALLLAAATVVSHNQAFWRSTVRYALPFFPIFYWMLLAQREAISNAKFHVAKRIMFALLIGLSFTIQIFYAYQFRSGAWAF